MKYFKITLEYHGGSYAGWQLQPNQPTVQGAVEEKLSTLLNAPIRVHASGRTDAGVHAWAQSAHFSTEKSPDPGRLQRGFNCIKPHDVIMKSIAEIDESFHARKNATGKWYRYRILNRVCPSPLESGFSWHIRHPLDLCAMEKAAHLLIGTHDFCSFRAANSDMKSSIRTIYHIKITQSPSLIISLDFWGNGFLKHMIRILVGTLLEVGKGELSPAGIKEILEAKDRSLAGDTAPACGLYLGKVFYQNFNELTDSTPVDEHTLNFYDDTEAIV